MVIGVVVVMVVVVVVSVSFLVLHQCLVFFPSICLEWWVHLTSQWWLLTFVSGGGGGNRSGGGDGSGGGGVGIVPCVTPMSSIFSLYLSVWSAGSISPHNSGY